MEYVSTARKVTVQLPADLLERAQRSSGESLTATIRKGLELIAAGAAYDELKRLEGKVAFSVDWRKLRSDRR
jgi:hypothetical protein